MPIDVERARRETPGCARVLHFNNAGASLLPAPVLDACTSHLRREAEVGGYEAAEAAREAVEATYRSIARLLNASPDEIALTESATRAWDMAFYGLRFEEGDRILTSPASYASNYIAFLHVARRTGAVVDVVPADADGQIDVDALRRLVDDRVRLIALTHCPGNGGLVNPAEEVGRVAREAGVPFLLDACQSAGQLPLDVEAIGCDMLSATGRKFLRGPRGTGFLYVRRGFLDELEPPMLDLHAAEWVGPGRYEMRPDARRFEQWEANVAGQIGLGVAVDYALGWRIDAVRDRVQGLAERLRGRLREVSGVTVHDVGRVRSGITSFSLAGMPSASVKQHLLARGINVSVSVPSTTLLDARARGLPEMVRASVHYFNTDEEIERFARAVGALAG